MESSEAVKNRASEFFHNIILMSALVNLKEPSILGAKYLGFFSSRSLKTREIYALVLLSLYIF